MKRSQPHTILSTLLIAVPCASFLISGQVSAQTGGFGVVGQSGNYNYAEGAYSGVTNNPLVNATFDNVEVMNGTIAEAESFIGRTTSFGAWRSFNDPGSGGVSLEGTLGLRGPGGLAPHVYGQQRPAANQWIGLRIGPFYLDNIYAGAGVLYSEYEGNPFGYNPNNVGTDNWASIIWAGARMTTYITDRFAFVLQPSVYYLPFENEVGWAFGNPFFGLGGWIAPQTLLQFAYSVPLNNWDFTIYDQFRAFFQNSSLLDEFVNIQASFMDTTPVDRVGRYQFGGFGSQQFDVTGNDNFALNDRLFGSDRVSYGNYGGFSLNGRHGDGLRTGLFYNRLDNWDSDFNHANAWNTAGAVILKESPFLTPYAYYQIRSTDDFITWYQHVVAGVNAQLNFNMIAYAQAGWLWTDLDRRGDDDTWIATMGFRQKLGPYTNHGFEAGRAPTDNGFGTQYLANYVRYFISQQMGARVTGALFAQQADLQFIGGPGRSDRSSFSAGGYLTVNFSPNSNLTLLTAYDNVDLDDIKRGWELWTYRATYMHRFGESLAGQIMYQYQHAGSGTTAADNFSEHVLFMGVIKQF